MNREEVLQALQDFKEVSGISRDKCIDIYNQFKASDEIYSVRILVSGQTVEIKREDFWNYINTTDIREVYSTGYTKISKDQEFETEMTKLRQEKLRSSDKLRFERNAFNKNLRELNALEDLNKELIESIKKLPKNIKQNKKVILDTNSGVGVVVISDTHFNELIDTPTNKYDFEIASKRLRKLALTAIEHFKKNDVNKVVVTLLGDLLNSDRRQSEYMNMATNRSKAMVLAFYLLRQFIQELSENFYLTVTSVTGNESRVVGEDFDTSDELATYNYDYTIHQFLKLYFEDNDMVQFIDGNFGEKIVNINGQNVLLTHGVALKNDLEKSVSQMFGRYGMNGINVDYLFCGHLHSARIGDTCSRCGSLCGSNSYSEGALNLNSRASQLIGIFYDNNSRNIMNVDLQNTDNINGYDIIEELESYNAKSVNKKNKFLVHNI